MSTKSSLSENPHVSNLFLIAIFSRAIQDVREYIRKHPLAKQVILYARVSCFKQNHYGNLEKSVLFLQDVCKVLGLEVVGTFRDTCSGRARDFENRKGLKQAIELSKCTGAPILAQDSSRFLRADDYHTRHKQNAVPIQKDLLLLKQFTQNTVLLTVLHPDATPKEVRSFQIKNGLQRRAKPNPFIKRKKHNKYNKEQRTALLPEAKRLRKEGFSFAQIGTKLGIHRNTARLWLKDWEARNRRKRSDAA